MMKICSRHGSFESLREGLIVAPGQEENEDNLFSSIK